MVVWYRGAHGAPLIYEGILFSFRLLVASEKTPSHCREGGLLYNMKILVTFGHVLPGPS